MSFKGSQEVPWIYHYYCNELFKYGNGYNYYIFFKCQKIVDENLPEIFKLIESKLDPQKVCSAMGLCAKFKDLVHHPEVKYTIVNLKHFEHYCYIFACLAC